MPALPEESAPGALLISGADIAFRKTHPDDLPFVLEHERATENRPFIRQWREAQHRGALTDPDVAHCIIVAQADKQRVGYLILRGLTNPERNLEFKRIVVVEKGRGFGRQAVQLVRRWAFEVQGAHRLWLEVRENNPRAHALYLSEGFIQEGILRDVDLVDGRYVSSIVMSMLEDEYRARQVHVP